MAYENRNAAYDLSLFDEDVAYSNGSALPKREEQEVQPLQTGQLNWPIPVLAVCGLAFIGGGLALILRKKRGSYGK